MRQVTEFNLAEREGFEPSAVLQAKVSPVKSAAHDARNAGNAAF